MTNRSLFWGAAGLGAGALLGNAWLNSPTSRLRGQTVLITGGSRGLGLALAREFAALGCHLVICARDAAELAVARMSLQDAGAEVLTIPCDVSDRSQVKELTRAVRSRFGQIDVLVNNAGVIRVGPVNNMTSQDFEDAMQVMFWGPVYLTLEILPEMQDRKAGRIAAITSVGGKVSIPHLLPYSCAKFAAVAFFEGLGAEVARDGVKVTTIAPGLMRTGSHRNAEFKGDHTAEASWFSLAASLPFISMSAERAAKQIVQAIAQGRREKILSTQANILARVNGAFPGFVPQMLECINRLLPSSTNDHSTTRKGSEAAPDGALFTLLTTLGRKAGQRLNEEPVTSQ